MMKENAPTTPDPDRKNAADRGETRRTGEGITDMRKANENIRKSQDEDGQAPGKPVIDRHR